MPHRLPLAKISNRRFQFGTRGLLLVVALAAILFAVMKLLSALMSLILVFALALVALHIFGNAWGTRLRHHEADDQFDSDRDALSVMPRTAKVDPQLRPGVTQLHQSTKLGWVMIAVTLTGALAGAIVGAVLLWNLEKRISVQALVVGAGSAAVLGGFVGFMTSSFVEIGLRAWWEAISWDTPDSLRGALAWRVASYALMVAGLVGGIACGLMLRSRAIIAAAEDAGDFADMYPAVDWALRAGLAASLLSLVAAAAIMWRMSRPTT